MKGCQTEYAEWLQNGGKSPLQKRTEFEPAETNRASALTKVNGIACRGKRRRTQYDTCAWKKHWGKEKRKKLAPQKRIDLLSGIGS